MKSRKYNGEVGRQPISDMVEELMDLRTDADIKNHIWELVTVRDDDNHVVSLWERENVMVHSAYAVFRKPSGAFNYVVYKMLSRSLGTHYESNKGRRNPFLLSAFAQMHVMVDEEWCKALCEHSYVTDDYKRDFNIKLVETKVMSDTNIFPSDIVQIKDNNRWYIPEFVFDTVEPEQVQDSD
jgi:hypothetical protein